jgi:alpha-amylase
MAAAANMVTYIMTHDGIPIIYYGQEQHLDGGTEPYTNRAALWEYAYDETAVLYKLIANLNLFRRHVSRNYAGYLTTESSTIDVGANTIAFAKGGDGQPKVITVLNNKLSAADDFKVDLCDTKAHGYASGDELFDVVACKSVTVSDSGCIEAWIADGEPVVLFKKSELTGSTLCGITGDSDVVVPSVYVSSTVITATASDGQLTVMHSATTMPWADAPASAKSSATSAAASNSKNSTSSATSSTSVATGQVYYVLFVLVSTFLISLSLL